MSALHRCRGLLSLLAISFVLAACGGGDTTDGDGDEAAFDPNAAPRRLVDLYFPGSDGKLHPETREVIDFPRPEGDIEAIVGALLEGPQTDGLWPPLAEVAAVIAAASSSPSTTDTDSNPTADGDQTADDGDQTAGDDDSSNATAGDPNDADDGAEADRPNGPRVVVYLIDETVYVDLPSPAKPPAIGAHQELLMLYSLVNSVLSNTPAERMVVLWDGAQPLTFAGHIDTASSLTAMPSLIAEAAP